MIALFFWLFAAFSTPAQATIVWATYCVDWSISYTDGTTGDLLTGSSTNAIEHTTDWDTDPGCKVVALDTHWAPYTVRILRKAVVDGNTIEVRDDTNALFSSVWYNNNHTPAHNTTYSTTATNGTFNTSNIMAAAGWALQRRNGGVTGETFTFITDGCSGGGSCYDHPDIYLNSSHRNYKFVIAHELGHALLYRKDGGAPNKDYGASLECVGIKPNEQPCCTRAYGDGSHKMNSKEYQSAAAVEGIAHFYSAVAFNQDNTDTDCDMEKHYTPDWDADGTPGNNDDDNVFSCEGAPVSGEVSGDYFGDRCDLFTTSNRATEYDYLRLFWDLRTDEGWSVETIFDIWDDANPNSWAKNDNTSGNRPNDRLSLGAYSVGHSVGGTTMGAAMMATWDFWADYNGTDR